MVMVMRHLWVSCPTTIVPGSQAYFCVYFIITSAPTNYFPLSILATATSNFFWHASLISDMLGVHVPFQGCPFGRIFILTTLSRTAPAGEANHYLGKSIKSNKIAPREQRSELDRFANHPGFRETTAADFFFTAQTSDLKVAFQHFSIAI